MIDMMISGLAELLGVALEAIVEIIMPVFDFDFTLFNTSFPFARTAYYIFQSVGLGIVLLLASVQIIPFFMGSRKNKTTPIRAGLFALLAVFGIYYGNYILTAIIDIAQMPYNALLNANIAYGSLAEIVEVNSMIDIIYDASYHQSVLVYIILLLLIGIAFVKLLLEAVERYVILFVLIYATPLAASTLASETSSGICKRFFTMFVSQCILLILNVWSLQMITSLFANMGNSDNPMVTLLIGYAFLRIASRLDSYLNSLGLNAAVTGAGLGAELMASGMAVLSRGTSFLGGKAANGSGGILGLSKAVSSGIGKISPISGAADAVKNFTFDGVGKTVAGAARAFAHEAGGEGGMQAGFQAAKAHWNTNFDKNRHDSWMKTQEQSWWARSFGQANAAASPTDKSVDQTLETMFNNGSMSSQELNDIANTSFAANRAFNHIPEDAEVTDAAAVASTLQGIGLTNVMPEANEAIQAGLGNINSDYMDYQLTANGAHMAYGINGKNHTLDVKNSSQMEGMSPQERSAYTSFKSGGNVYYAKHQTNADKTGAMLSRMQKSGEPVVLSEGNRAQFSDFLNSTRWNGISPKTQQKVTTAIQSGSEQVSGRMDGNHFRVSTEAGPGVSIITGSAVSADGSAEYTPKELESRGYTYTNVGGNEYWTKEYTETDRMSNTFFQMQQSSSSMRLSDENKSQFTDLINSTHWNGVSPKTQQAITTAIQGGDGHIDGGMDSRRFWVETEKGGISIISSEGITTQQREFNEAGQPVYHTSTLENRGYSYNKVNGKEFWVKETTQIPDDFKDGKHLFQEY